MLFSCKLIVLLLLIHSINGKSTYYSGADEHIVKIARDAAWLWFNNESAIFIDQSLYIGCEDSMGNSQVIMYQIRDKKADYSGIDYDLSSWAQKRRRYPTHNYPSLIRTGTDQILAVYHNSKNEMFYRSGKILHNGTDKQQIKWSEESVLQLNSGMNYSNLLHLSSENSIYNFFSIYEQSPSLIISPDNGKSWSEETVIIGQAGNGTSPYMRLSGNGVDRIDILYTDGHPRTALSNNIYHLYYKDRQFFRSDGALIASMEKVKKEPLLPEAGTRLFDGSITGPGWVWDIEYDTDNNPVAVFISSADGKEGNDLRYHYAKWVPDKDQWMVYQIAYAGSRIYVPENHFAGGISIDPVNTDVVYISSNADPVTGNSSTNPRYQIFRGVTSDKGKSWNWEKLTYDTDRDNFRPIVPRDHNFKNCVIWFSQKAPSGRGFNSEIMGIFEK